MIKRVIAAIIGLVLAGAALASDITYRKDIRPLWEAKCAACHGASSPYLGEFLENTDKYKKMSRGPRMDTYADLIFFVGWPDTGAVMRRLDETDEARWLLSARPDIGIGGARDLEPIIGRAARRVSAWWV